MSKIKEILDLALFPADAIGYFDETCERAESDTDILKLLDTAKSTYLSGNDTKSQREELSALLDCHIYTVDMLLLLYCAVELREIYRENGYADELFLGVLTDLRCKLAECRRVYGIWGTFVFSWFFRFYNCTRFMLGRLQYETVASKYDYKDTVHVGDTVYNCHIPSAGPLTPESVEKSLRLAYEFYKIEGDMPVVCHSWLLYPEHQTLFGANTRAFADRFDIISTDVQETNGDAWRIFGRSSDDLEALPQDTSLQRNFYRYLKNGNKMGNGFGIMLYKPEKNNEKN